MSERIDRDQHVRAGTREQATPQPIPSHSTLFRLIRSAWLATKRLWYEREPLHDVERRHVINSLFPQGMPRREFFTRFAALMLLATAIAVLGILADSTAVVVGAMLVAPLMFPVLGTAAAIVMGWPRRIIHRTLLITVGSLLAVFMAALISFIVPGRMDPLPAELMARTSPNVLDLGIALAAGAAGAYGQVRRRVIGIVIAASITFLAAGFVPGRNPLKGHTSILRGMGWAAVATIIVVLPMQFGRGNVLPLSDQTEEVTAIIEDYVAERGAAAEVVDVEVEIQSGTAEVDIVVASSLAAPSANALAQRLARYLSSPVRVRLLLVTSETKRAKATP
ncbi:MAG: DUF389 domain-containing protein [Acidimicrobiia bacterium]